MTILTVAELKSHLGSQVSEFSQEDLENIVEDVITEIQSELNVDIFREYMVYMDRTRKNSVNGTNTTFYIYNYLDKWFADRNGDGSVTIADVIVYAVDSVGTETKPTISSIDNDNRSITLETAPESVRLFIDYSYSFFDMSTPDRRIKRLAKYLALTYSYFELELDLIGTSAKMGNISLSGINTNSKTAKYKNRYEALLKELKAYGTAKNKPTIFNVTKPLNYRPSKHYGYRYFYPTAENRGIDHNYGELNYWGMYGGY